MAGAVAYYGWGRFQDSRGFYEEVEFTDREGQSVVQSGFAGSRRNVLRGLHRSPYGKLVVCMAGEVFDAILDLRPNSPTFLRWDTIVLSPERCVRLYVPPGVGHGYFTFKDGSLVLYMKFGHYDRAKEIEVSALDPAIGIPWPKPLDGAADYIMSPKDRGLPGIAEVLGRLAGVPVTESSGFGSRL